MAASDPSRAIVPAGWEWYCENAVRQPGIEFRFRSEWNCLWPRCVLCRPEKWYDEKHRDSTDHQKKIAWHMESVGLSVPTSPIVQQSVMPQQHLIRTLPRSTVQTPCVVEQSATHRLIVAPPPPSTPPPPPCSADFTQRQHLVAANSTQFASTSSTSDQLLNHSESTVVALQPPLQRVVKIMAPPPAPTPTSDAFKGVLGVILDRRLDEPWGLDNVQIIQDPSGLQGPAQWLQTCVNEGTVMVSINGYRGEHEKLAEIYKPELRYLQLVLKLNLNDIGGAREQ